MNKSIFKRNGIYFLGILMMVLLGFTPAKYNKGFKNEKKKLDTLTVLTSFVQISANNNKYKVEDIELSIFNQRLIDSVTINLLQKKYVLNKSQLSTNRLDFVEIFESLENSSKTLNKISSKKLFKNLKINLDGKYALILLLNGQYHPEFPPHYTRDAAFMSGTIIISPNNPIKAESDLRLLVINTENDEIVFYDRINSSQYDARVSSEIKIMTRKILKKIYYK